MRHILIGLAGLIVALAFAPPPAGAEEYPWCLFYGGDGEGGGSYSCGFVAFEQCQASLRGNSGICMRNPFAATSSPNPQPRRHHGARRR